jgi:hypothetical protein
MILSGNCEISPSSEKRRSDATIRSSSTKQKTATIRRNLRALGRNITKAQLSFRKFFYVSSGVDFSKVKGPFRVMLSVFRKVMEKKKEKTADEEAILQGFTHPTNYVDRKHIESIVAYAREWRPGGAR